MQILKKLKSILKPRFRGYILENKYRIVPAFEMKGTKYYMFDSQFEVPTGRQFAAIAFYNEMDMRTDKQYLEDHIKAMEKVLSNPKGIHIGHIAQLNSNLKERLQLMILPDFIYKLASVVFFDENESPYKYDFDYNENKIKAWKENGETLDFFLKTPLVDLIPSLKSAEGVSKTYFNLAQEIDKIHRGDLLKLLSEKMSTKD